MARSRPGRLVALLLTLWLAVVMTEPAAVHACAMHDGPAGTAMHMTHGARAPGAPGGHGAPGARRAQCTCLGDCCAVVLTTPPAAHTLAFAPALVVEARPAIARPAPRRSEPAHVLPPALGPPTLLVG